MRQKFASGVPVGVIAEIALRRVSRNDLRSLFQRAFSISLSDAQAITGWLQDPYEVTRSRLNSLLLPSIVAAYSDWHDSNVDIPWVSRLLPSVFRVLVNERPPGISESLWERLADGDRGALRRLHNAEGTARFRCLCLSAQIEAFHEAVQMGSA